MGIIQSKFIRHMKATISMAIFLILSSSVLGQYGFTDSSVCAGVPLKKLKAVPLLSKCSDNQTGVLIIQPGENFIITAADSCIEKSVKQYKYIVRYKKDFFLVDTAFVKTTDPFVFHKFRQVKDKFKAMTYGVFTEYVINHPQSTEKVDQVERLYLNKTVAAISQQFKTLQNGCN